MQIIIEGYQYPAGSVDKVLWEGAFQTVDGKVSIGYVYQEIRIIRKVGFALSGRRRGRVRPRPVNIG